MRSDGVPDIATERDARFRWPRVAVRAVRGALFVSLAVACQADVPVGRITPSQPQPGDSQPTLLVERAGADASIVDAPVADAIPPGAVRGPVVGQQVVLRNDIPRVRASRTGPYLNISPAGYLTTEVVTVAELVDADVRVTFDVGDVRFWLWVGDDAVLPVVLEPTEVSLSASPAGWSREGAWITVPLTAVRVDEYELTAGWARIGIPPIPHRRLGWLQINGYVPSRLLARSFDEERIPAAPAIGHATARKKDTRTALVVRRTEILDQIGGRTLATIDASAYRRVPVLEVKDEYVLTEVRGVGVVVVGWVPKEALSEGPSSGSGYGEAGKPRPQRIAAGTCVFDSTGQPVGVVVKPTKLGVWKNQVSFAIPWGWDRFTLKPTESGWERCPDEPPWNNPE